jgi:hypothetical protein
MEDDRNIKFTHDWQVRWAHPYSPAGGGGPGRFRSARPLGSSTDSPPPGNFIRGHIYLAQQPFPPRPAPAPTPVIPRQRFVVSNIDKLEKETAASKVSFLDDKNIAQCARLPLEWQINQEGFFESRLKRSGRLSENWVMGESLRYGMYMERGTVIATFNPATGKYAQTDSGQGGENHTAIFLNWKVENGARGMSVIQQMSERNGIAQFGFIPFDNKNKYYLNAYRFSCVMIPK